MTTLPEGFYEDTDRELGWDDQIEKDGPEFVLLAEGDYDFEVIDFERARHPGSDKLPPCNKAVVHIKIQGKDAQGKDGVTTIKHNLFLHTKTEGMLCAFFTGIGQRKKGEKVTMNWTKVPGSTGRCKVGVRTYKKEGGDAITYNEIKKFYEPADDPLAGQIGFTEGEF